MNISLVCSSCHIENEEVARSLRKDHHMVLPAPGVDDAYYFCCDVCRRGEPIFQHQAKQLEQLVATAMFNIHLTQLPLAPVTEADIIAFIHANNHILKLEPGRPYKRGPNMDNSKSDLQCVLFMNPSIFVPQPSGGYIFNPPSEPVDNTPTSPQIGQMAAAMHSYGPVHPQYTIERPPNAFPMPHLNTNPLRVSTNSAITPMTSPEQVAKDMIYAHEDPKPEPVINLPVALPVPTTPAPNAVATAVKLPEGCRAQVTCWKCKNVEFADFRDDQLIPWSQDTKFTFTCSTCSPDHRPHLSHAQKSKLEFVGTVLYNLHVLYKQASYSTKEIYDFAERHLVFLNSSNTDFKGVIRSTLAYHRQIFYSPKTGVWGLREFKTAEGDDGDSADNEAASLRKHKKQARLMKKHKTRDEKSWSEEQKFSDDLGLDYSLEEPGALQPQVQTQTQTHQAVVESSTPMRSAKRKVYDIDDEPDYTSNLRVREPPAKTALVSFDNPVPMDKPPSSDVVGLFISWEDRSHEFSGCVFIKDEKPLADMRKEIEEFAILPGKTYQFLYKEAPVSIAQEPTITINQCLVKLRGKLTVMIKRPSE